MKILKKGFKINRTIWLLMISDVLVMTGFGLIEPIIAIYINDRLVGGTIYAAGLATFIFLATKSVIQLPMSRFVDSRKHKCTFLIIGTLLLAVNPLIYVFATHVNYIYLAELIQGIGAGLAYPTWLGIWSLKLDNGHESFEWSLYSTATSLGAAGSAAIGGFLAQFVGFQFTFLIVSIATVFGAILLFWLDHKNEGRRNNGGGVLVDLPVKPVLELA